MNLKADTEYIFKTGNTISYDGTIPLKQMQEIVRCKDCKHYEVHKQKVLENCERNGHIIPMKSDDFCSYGERKGGAE